MTGLLRHELSANGRERCLLALVLLIFLGPLVMGSAEEQELEFLEGLRRRGLYAEALEYLDRIAEEMNAPKEVLSVIDYERGITLIQMSRAERDPARRENQLLRAADFLKRFCETQRTHSSVPNAQSRLANVLVEGARRKLGGSNHPKLTKDETDRLLKEARDHYREAAQILAGVREQLKRKLEEIAMNLDHADPDHKSLIQLRDKYRSVYLQARLLLPTIQEELGDSYIEKHAKRREALQAAAKEYGEFHSTYRRQVAGLFARIYEGRCWVKLEEFSNATECFDDLLAQSKDANVLKAVRRRTLVVAAECWLHDEVRQYERVIKEVGSDIAALKDHESRMPDWLGLRLSLARAYLASAKPIQSKTEPTANEKQQLAKLVSAAKTHLTFVCSRPSDHQTKAQAMFRAQYGEMPPTAPSKASERSRGSEN